MQSCNDQLRITLLLSALLFPLQPLAEIIELKDKSEIIGTWVLEAVAPSLKKNRVAENRVWKFREDGIINISGFNRKVGKNSSQDVQYRIEDGKILTPQVGRPGNFLTYRVYEKSDTLMTLKGGIEGFYFFKRKQ